MGDGRPPGLLLDKTAGARGTHGIHGTKGNLSILQGGKFRILAAYLDNRIHLRIQFHGRAGVGGNFIYDQIGTNNFTAEFTPGSGCGRCGDTQRYLCVQ